MGFLDSLKKGMDTAKGVMEKDMKNQCRRMSDSQLKKLANQGNSYAADELRRRGK